jgi:hypothetical protein
VTPPTAAAAAAVFNVIDFNDVRLEQCSADRGRDDAN